MRICMLAYSIYEADNRILRYANALAKRGNTVDVISLRAHGQGRAGTVDGVNVFRIQKRDFHETSVGSYLRKILLFHFRAMWLLTWRHLRTPYDVVHVHSIPDFLVFAAWFPKITGTPIILDIHDLLPEFYSSKFGTRPHSLACRLLWLEERLSTAFSDHVIISNHLWHKTLTARSVKDTKCSVVLNLPDRSVFHPQGTRRSDDTFIVMFPGSLNWHQGVDLAIRAFAVMKQRIPNAEFHIIGDGSEKKHLSVLARELLVQDSVLIGDGVPIVEVARRMENAHLGVVPKRSDSFGNEAFSTKILEFMAMGVPVIVSDTAIDRYYFNDSVVKFFRSGDVDDLAASMIRLAEDSHLRQSLICKAAEFVRKNDWDTTKQSYLLLVDSLANHKGTPL